MKSSTSKPGLSAYLYVKKKTPKVPSALNKTQRTPGPKFNQQKNPVPSHKNFQEALNDITIMNLQIVLNTQNNPT